jgi:dihydropyrimidine dehydrogenase (NAD+) subunit PreA
MKPVELGVNFCGIRFANPFIVAASPSTRSGDMVRRAFDHGWAGVVWKTVGTITGVDHPKVSPCYAHEGWNEQLYGFENIDLGNDVPLEQSFKEILEVKKDCSDFAVIVSIRGENYEEKWRDLARRAEDVGADMIELMFSCPHDIADSPNSEGKVGQQARAITEWARGAVRIPIMVKMSPNVTDIRIPARAAKAGGADAISATNTIRSILGVDFKTLRPLPTVGGMSAFGGYSGPAIKPITLRMVAELAGDPKLSLPLSAIGGVVSWVDAVEYMLLGASTVQVGTATMFYGFRIIDDLLSGMENFLRGKGLSSVSDLIGLSLPYITTQPALDRKSPVRARPNLEKCLKCLRCYVACRDGAYQAIEVGPDRSPQILEKQCQGCSLCAMVCPAPGAIEMVPCQIEKISPSS